MKIIRKLLSILMAALFLFGTVPGVPLGTRNADADSPPILNATIEATDVKSTSAQIKATITKTGGDISEEYQYSISDGEGHLKTGSFTMVGVPQLFIDASLTDLLPNKYYVVTLNTNYPSGTYTALANTGFYTMAQISGCVFYDLNNNGTKDTGEVGIPGVTVTLYNETTKTSATTTTDAMGMYYFDRLSPGITYTVTATTPPGYAGTFTIPPSISIVEGAGENEGVDFGFNLLPPAAPAGLWANLKNQDFTKTPPVFTFELHWGPSTGATAYYLDIAGNQGFTENLTSVGPINDTVYTFTTVLSGIFFRVRAYNAGGDSPWSNTASTGITQVPTITNVTASHIGTSSATLHGIVNASNHETDVSFEYGLDTNYGTAVSAAPSFVNGNELTDVSADIRNLTPNTTYHFRGVTTMNQGTNRAVKLCGDDMIFTTLPASSSNGSDEYSPSTNTFSPPSTVTAQPASTTAVVSPPTASVVPQEYTATFTLGETTYYINGEAHEMDTVPFVQGERVLIPQKYLGIALGIPDDETHMKWDDATKTATFVTADGKEATCSVGSKVLIFDGQEIQMDAEPVAQDGHIFLPARFLTEAMGGTVSWDDLAKTVTIKITR